MVAAVILVRAANDRKTLLGSLALLHLEAWKQFVEMMDAPMADVATSYTLNCIIFRGNFPAVP